ncbi:MAG: hypothetical protein KJP00_10155, partial [Bacteroidia bacterium]|nr:hypothetical protein [Bacteroidia bacterium]
YELLVSGVKNVSKGELQIAGEPDDQFGNMTFFSKRDRIYKISLTFRNNDSLSFILPESGGFLKLKKEIDGRVGIQGST